VNFLNAATNIRRRNLQSVSNIHVMFDQKVEEKEDAMSKDATVNQPSTIDRSPKKVEVGHGQLTECDQ